ncbi:GA-binding protein subunit beta-2 isoform X2 [Nilaparvata lugens]|uniref:GA-binding protein subunit beta-2 isoform X2 n=1 Tax=Nilaparvata lugens TaxID=108931 RepID=UPI000B97D0A8|nr:GA-binding protein subunit beta-2 isoform X2 [Nilaparvata lugens]XP_039290093.1 GA-binding protein subunit beta-2 isoform X2 [Nilaparvata lugens]
MQTFIGDNVFPIERTYMDVPPSALQSAIAHPSGRSSQAVGELGNRLLEASKKGDLIAVQECISKGAPFSTDWLGTSPLHFAAQNNHLSVCVALLTAGISRDARNKVERTPLHVAAQEGHYHVVNTLIEYGADVDCKDMVRMTPLHWAAENGDANIVKLLLNSGADPNVENKFDMTPDYIAFQKERLDIVEMLREASNIDQLTRISMKEKAVKKEKQSDKETNKKDYENGKKISPHLLARVLANRKAKIINELPPTPPVEDSTSDCDRLEDELIEIARNQQDLNQAGIGAVPASNRINNSATRTATIQSMKTINSNSSAMQMLNAHGITMLPDDNSSLIESAVQSGQTVMLTEAGKLAFNSTKVNVMQNRNGFSTKFVNSSNISLSRKVDGGISKAVRNVQVIKTKTPTTIQCKKVFPISSEQLINMTKEKKVIIHNGDKRQGKPVQFVCAKPMDPALAAKLGNITVTNANASKQNETNSSSCSPPKRPRTEDTPEYIQLRKELIAAKKQIQTLQESLKTKERENRQYKLQIDTLLKIKMVKP